MPLANTDEPSYQTPSLIFLILFHIYIHIYICQTYKDSEKQGKMNSGKERESSPFAEPLPKCLQQLRYVQGAGSHVGDQNPITPDITLWNVRAERFSEGPQVVPEATYPDICQIS